MTAPAEPKRMGRPPVPPELKLQTVSIRLNASQARALREVDGAADKVRSLLDRLARG